MLNHPEHALQSSNVRVDTSTSIAALYLVVIQYGYLLLPVCDLIP